MTGLDFGAALMVAKALNYDTTIMIELLQFGEAGLVAGLKPPDDGTNP